MCALEKLYSRWTMDPLFNNWAICSKRVRIPALDVCIFPCFELNCVVTVLVMPLRSFANFKLVMSRNRKELRGTQGHGP